MRHKMAVSAKHYLPSIVYGGSDGAVSYFSLMAGAYGAGLPIKMLIAIGISNIFADAFSMASADYLSEDSRSESERDQAFRSATVTFFSFLLVGLFPLAPSLYAYNNGQADMHLPLSIFIISTILTILAFSFIGYLRGKILLRSKWRTIMQSIMICSISAAVAYYIGEMVSVILM